MNDLDTPPVDRSVRDRLESMTTARGILVGAALSVPVWAVGLSALAAVHALAMMR